MKITAPKGWSTKPFDKVVFPTQAQYEAMPDKIKAQVHENGGYLTAKQDEDYRFNVWCDEQSFEHLA
jgi:hypothetical protein